MHTIYIQHTYTLISTYQLINSTLIHKLYPHTHTHLMYVKRKKKEEGEILTVEKLDIGLALARRRKSRRRQRMPVRTRATGEVYSLDDGLLLPWLSLVEGTAVLEGAWPIGLARVREAAVDKGALLLDRPLWGAGGAPW